MKRFRRKFIYSDGREAEGAIAAAGGQIQLAALILGISPQKFAGEKRRYRRDEEVMLALRATGGRVVLAANLLGISPQALYGRLEGKPYLSPVHIRSPENRHNSKLTDKECEELIGVRGDDVEKFLRMRDALRNKGPSAIGTRLDEIAEAAAPALGCSSDEAIARLKARRPLLQLVKMIDAETQRRELLRPEETRLKRAKWRRRKRAFLKKQKSGDQAAKAAL